MAEYKKFARPMGSRPQRPFNGASSQQRELYDAECNKCHNRCQVPFRPNGKKPVYCANCFVKDESRDGGSSFNGRSDFKPRFSNNAAPSASNDRQIQELKSQIEAMNRTLEKLVTAIDASNRATSLTNEIRKHLPATEDAEATAAPKKAAKAKVVKKTAKKASKK